jgi:putative addiction module component (TIGR02574 family)
MTNEVVELFKRASELHENDRAMLAGLLIESLESERETGVEAAWLDEVQRRLAELDSGAVKTVPWEKVRAKLLRLLDES